MAYHDELLAQAVQLAQATPPIQANLRRAVSAAYYSVFHLLISEATSNWSQPALRPLLGRAFDHALMKAVSRRVANPQASPYPSQPPSSVTALREVAQTFSELQEERHFADYNLTEDLAPVEALAQVKSAEAVFAIWPSIRTEPIAQEYLVSMLLKRS